MSYDFDDCKDRSPPEVEGYVPVPHDLEYICVLMQLATIYLTNQAGDTFTYQQLFNQAKELAGDEFALEEVDFKIVFNNYSSLLKKEKGGLLSMK